MRLLEIKIPRANASVTGGAYDLAAVDTRWRQLG